MLVNITVVTQNRLSLTRICLESLLPTIGDRNIRVTVVDNGSDDGSREYLEGLASMRPQVKLYTLPRNMGVSIAANLGWADVEADYYMKLDNDIAIHKPDWLDRLIEVMDRNADIGMAAYRCCLWHAVTPVTLASGHTFLQSCGCNGGCVLIPRRVHEKLGFWNEDYGRYGYEDVDYNNRVLLMGLRIGYMDDTQAVSHPGFSHSVDPAREERKRRSIASAISGEKLYLLNKFLYEQGIRPMYTERKYLPDFSGDTIVFRHNPAYLPILRLHQDLLRKARYTVSGDTISLDLSAFRAISE